MRTEDTYQKLVRKLRNSDPFLDNKTELTDEIIRSIRTVREKRRASDRLFASMFAWVDSYWLRGTMAVFALLFIVSFIGQQLSMASRLSNLEVRMQGYSTSAGDHRPELEIMKAVLVNRLLPAEDSVTVSKADLEELLNSYLELQKSSHSGKKNYLLEPVLHKRIRQNPEKSTNDNEI